MMSQSGEYSYLARREFQAIRLPYGEENISLFVFLPNRAISYHAFLALLTPENWTAWRESFGYREGEIHLPRFRYEYSQDLGTALMRLGMSLAFDRFNADFSRLAPPPPPFCLDFVRHKTFVEVKEEGTEAAAVTVLAEFAGIGPSEPDDRFTMIVDRPFFCAIVDERTEALLFMGAIVEP
jgi:serpin B